MSNQFTWLAFYASASGFMALAVGLKYLKWVQIPDLPTGLYVFMLYSSHFMILSWLVALPLFF